MRPPLPSPQTFTINQATVHVDVNPASKTYGRPDPTPSYTLRAADFQNGGTASSAGVSGSASCSISTQSENAGSYSGVIRCSPGALASRDYAFTSGTSASVTINPAGPAIDTTGRVYRSNTAVYPGMTISCPAGGTACSASTSVTVRLGTANTPFGPAPHRRVVTLGRGTIQVSPGGSTKASFVLTPFGMVLLGDHRQIQLTVRIDAANQVASVAVTRTIVLHGHVAHYAIPRLQVHSDGRVTVTTRVSSPGTVYVPLTAWKDNLGASAARALQPAPGRFAVARAIATTSRAGSLTLHLTPDARGRELIAHPAYPVTLRTWVSYVPLYASQVDAGYYGLHLDQTCGRCQSKVTP